MNIIQTEDLVKGLPDDRLMKEAQQPSGKVPQFLLVSEVQRRADMRKRFANQQADKPQGTIADQIIGGGQQQPQQGPPPQMPQQLPKGPGIAPNPGNPPPPQNPNAAIAPRGMARGGIVGYAGGGYLSINIDGQDLQISTEGYGSDQDAFEAFRAGTNPPKGGGDNYGDSNPEPNPYYRGRTSNAPFGQGAVDMAFSPEGEYLGSRADAGAGPPAGSSVETAMALAATGSDVPTIAPSPQQGPQPPPQYHNTPDPAPTSFGGEGVGAALDQFQLRPTPSRQQDPQPTEFGGDGLRAALDTMDSGQSWSDRLTPEYRKREDFDPLLTLGTTPRHDNPAAAAQAAAGGDFVGPPISGAGLPQIGSNPQREAAGRGWDSFTSGLSSLAGTVADPLAGASLGGDESFSSSDIDEAIANSGGAGAAGVASLPVGDNEFVGPPAPKDTPQESGLTDATVQGATAQKENVAYNELMAMKGQKSPPVPGMQDLIGEQRNAGYSNLLMQLGAGIMKGDMAGGVERGGAAMALANREARGMEVKSRMAQYGADRADRQQDIDILGKAAQIEVRMAADRVDQMDRQGINDNAILDFVEEMVSNYSQSLAESGIIGPDAHKKTQAYMKKMLRGSPRLFKKLGLEEEPVAPASGERKSLYQINQEG